VAGSEISTAESLAEAGIAGPATGLYLRQAGEGLGPLREGHQVVGVHYFAALLGGELLA
jgi:hypothetical protein